MDHNFGNRGRHSVHAPGIKGPRPHIALGTIDSQDSVGTPRAIGRSRLLIREIKLGPDAPQSAPLSVSLAVGGKLRDAARGDLRR